MFVHWIGGRPSNRDVAISLCLFVRFGRAIIFAFPLVSCRGYLDDIVVRAVIGLMVLLTIHGARTGAYVPIEKGGIVIERWRKKCARQIPEILSFAKLRQPEWAEGNNG